ncbi:hypothetical protein C9374_011755 [Naegleria lovaniensis]|uniref:Uncharacterized protein n=1 Tax=Naegleria lovaniensis TaxID=51637 RepID=A0AA88GEA4_NAELO|nr:uncharacterized protein C9374_011755 [Naegleria lovaniensis]KAG2373870.1 hypothetical protein C9374_011755 [Naegleria lovaniensis]
MKRNKQEDASSMSSTSNDSLPGSLNHDKKKKLKTEDARLLGIGMNGGADKKKMSDEERKKAIQNLSAQIMAKPSVIANSSSSLSNTSKKSDNYDSLTFNSITEIPIDYTLKTFIVFKSSRDFLWTNNITSNSKTCGLSSFVTGTPTSDVNLFTNNLIQSKGFSQASNGAIPVFSQNQPSVDYQASSEFYKSLLYYIYPSSLLPHCLLSKIKELPNYSRENLHNISSVYESFQTLTQLDIQFMNDRYLCWSEALLSVFSSFIEGLCPYFYLLYDYTYRSSIIFLNDTVFSGAGKRCVISNPSSDIMKSLREEQIEFQEFGIGSEMRTEADNIMLASRTEEVSSQFKCLIVSGRKQLHALVDFLTNYHLKFLDCDIPQIVSPNSFLNSTLKKCKLFPRSCSDKDFQFLLEIRGGYLLPHSFLDICKIIQKSHSELSCSVKEFKEETSRLNDIQGKDLVCDNSIPSQGVPQANFQHLSYVESEQMRGHTIKTVTQSKNNSTLSLRMKKV